MQVSARPPLARIAAIDRAIRAGNLPNASTLGRQLEVSPRTIQRDIVFLRDQLQAPVEFDSQRNGYRYTQPQFRLPFFQLTEGELVALFLADRLLRQYRGTCFEHELERAYGKIVRLLPSTVSIDLSAVAEVLSVMPTVLTVQDVETFRTVSHAVLHGRRLEIAYWTAWRNELTRRTIDPYHLTLVDDDWYLMGYCHLRQEVRTFSVVRIRSVRETGATFCRPDDFHIDRYLSGCFRVVRGERMHTVVLRFVPAAASRVAEKVWHKSQTAERTEEGCLMLRMVLFDLREIKPWILSWGAECEVLEPEELRTMIKDELVRMGRHYVPSSTPDAIA